MTDLQGWDEFSAYVWLNSPQGKKQMGIPLTEHVTIQQVRQYIAASPVESRVTPKGEGVADPIEPKGKVSDLEYLMAPLQEFAERVIDLLRIGLKDD